MMEQATAFTECSSPVKTLCGAPVVRSHTPAQRVGFQKSVIGADQ
jgi:hypothetical protein